MTQSVELTAEQRRARLKRLMQERVRDATLAPLSPAQERLWFVEKISLGGAYTETRVLRVAAPVKAAYLAAAWQRVWGRHEVLRTCFLEVDGLPIQKIKPELSMVPCVVDCAGINPARHVDQLESIARAQAVAPFDLQRGPLIRFGILQFSPANYALVLTLHHIIADARSAQLLILELFECYRFLVTGQPAALPRLTAQYRDYARWEREQAEQPARQDGLEFWKRQLAGAATLELPTSWPRPLVRNTAGAVQHVRIAGGLFENIRTLARAEGCTLFMVLVAAVQVLLARYSGQQDIVIGSPVSGRNRSEFENLVGLFVNMLPLRGDLSGNPSFRELLARVRRMCLEAISHQDVPFEKIVEAIQPQRSQARDPIFQVALGIYPELARIPLGPGIECSLIEVPDGVSKYDMTWFFLEGPTELRGSLEYRRDLFADAMTASMVRHLQRVLEVMTAQPQTRIDAFAMVSAEELQHLGLSTDGVPQAAVPVTCVDQLFSEQAAAAPDRIAVVCSELQLSYGLLDQRSSDLARTLRGQGVTAETIIGICLDRSAELVLAILGVVRAGGAYLPLDPSYPPARLEMMLADSRARIVVTREKFAAQFAGGNLRVIFLDRELDRVAASSSSAPAHIEPAQLAYVIYTSGSTGRPKGTGVTHGNLARLFRAAAERMTFGPHQTWTMFHSAAFDFSVWELWGALAFGGRLVVVPFLTSRSPASFWELLQAEMVTVLSQTPSAFGQLISVATGHLAIEPSRLSLRLVILGGERLEYGMLAPWIRAFGDECPQLINMYGITETSVHVTWYRVLSHEVLTDDRSGGSVIGRALNDLQTWLLDRSGQVVPPHVDGELYVGGAGVARGYLHQPGLTAARFIPHPWASSAGSRLYRSGDRARWRTSAALDYRGRFDQQVKIRGFRIEPGEIESLLAKHPAVQQAMITVWRDELPELSERLIAYIVPTDLQHGFDAKSLRQYLSERLPDYMVPARFVLMESIPQTSSGKIDRHNLPAPTQQQLGTAGDVAPRDQWEAQLVEIFQKVLGLERVGVEDNFFELGGDSIQCIQLVAKAGQLGIKLVPQQVFQFQTVAELARVAAAATPGSLASQEPVRGPAPLAPIQHWFFRQQLPQPEHYNQSVLFSLRQRVQPDRFRSVMEELVTRHDALRLRFARTETGSWRQQHAEVADVISQELCQQLDLADLPQHRQSAAVAQAVAQLQASLHVTRGPLMRAALFELGDRQLWLWAIHHLVVDGVSWRILFEDFWLGYQQAQAGHRPQGLAKTSSYAAWTRWLEKRASAEEVVAEQDYWREVAHVTAPELPVRQRAALECAGESLQLTFNSDEVATRALLTTLPAAYRVPADYVLLTALTAALIDWTGDHIQLLDLESHGRQVDEASGLDLSRTVGWFTSLYPVRLELPTDFLENPGAALEAIKEQLRAVPDQGTGYGVRRYLAPGGDELASRAQISFNYLGRVDPLLVADGPAQLSDWSAGRLIGPRNPLSHLVSIDAAVHAGRLETRITYGARSFRQDTIQKLAERFQHHLLHLALHAQQGQPGGLTPADFPLVACDQTVLDRLVTHPEEIEDIYPLSPLQQGMLFHTLYAPRAGVYFEQFLWSFEGDLDWQSFRAAWQTVLGRHAVLRTAFRWEELSEPVQVVHREVHLPWVEFDWRHLSGAEQDRSLQAFLENDRTTGFDLARPPLLRLTLLRMQDAVWKFLWSHHHLLLDGWSVSILWRELVLSYEAVCRAQPLQLPRPAAFRDFVAWLRRQEQAAALDFWREQLEGFQLATPLEIGGHGDTEAASGYSRHELHLDGEEVSAIRHFGRQHRLTLSTVFQGAWGLLLSRYCGRNDVVFGSTVSGRSAPLHGIETMVGLLINIVPVRIRVDEDETVVNWLTQIQREQSLVRQYEHTPPAELHRCSEVPAGQPLFESLVVLENYPLDRTLAVREGSPRLLDVKLVDRTNYPLTLVITPGPSITIAAAFDAGRFGKRRIVRLLTRLRSLIRICLANPDQRLGQIDIPCEAEAPTQGARAGNEPSLEPEHSRNRVAPLSDEEWNLLHE